MEKKSKRILIVTQSVDKKNQVLGFFHRWIEEFEKKFESVTVICLEKGEYDLPKNVSVFSLGKESGVSRTKYLINFYRYIWMERRNYDVVFVHMNQEYVLLGGLFWKIMNKGVTMWRNHPKGGFFTRVSIYLSDKVYCTSKYSFTAGFNKTIIMPVGIDTTLFRPNDKIEKINNSILCLGRIAPVKNLHIIIDALLILKKRGKRFVFSFYGDYLSKYEKYFDQLNNIVIDYGLSDMVAFNNGIPNYKTPDIFNKYEIFINVTDSGSFDKTILEAMSCELVVVTSNNDLKKELRSDYFVEDINPLCIADKLDKALSDNLKYINKRDYVIKNHSIDSLVSKYIESIFSN